MKHFFESELMLSSSLNFVLLSVGLTLLLHIPIWCGFNLSRRKWKRMDYLWPFLAGIGMLGAVSEIRAKVAGDWVETEQTRAVVILESIEQFSLERLRGDVCSGQPSASDQADYHQACMWYLATAKTFRGVDFSLLPSAKTLMVPAPDIALLESDSVWVSGMLNQYEKQKNQYIKTREAQLKQPIESLFWYVSPYLVCFAIALRLTKVTAELKLDKASS
ncbi:hypothetical protein [Vibrio fortis]|uniref:hypothetical protein n=1 Tax=Vibrio fortis TaxID=212667 RepID=UPI0021C32D4D|nr:hypothetical protein [Vibrio fortis]